MIGQRGKERDICPLCGVSEVNECDICDVCGWEYTRLELIDPDKIDGCNHVSLNEGKLWFAKYGRNWYEVWWQKVVEHYGEKNAYDKLLNDETGWRPETPKE